MNNKSKKPKQAWPTKAVMTQIYEKGLWGENGTQFYSGDGSHNAEVVKPYLKEVISFLETLESPITICDLGCGDFAIGNKLVPYSKKYIAVDIVSELIAYNRANYHQDNVEFQCLDIATDTLPNADCVILRQVLQHLSNAEIEKILAKLNKYKYVLLTEHLPAREFVPNKDKVSSMGIRLKNNSGIDVFAPPFNLKATEKIEMLRIKDELYGGVIVTNLITMF